MNVMNQYQQYLTVCPWRICSLSRGNTAPRSRTPRSAPGPADPSVAWVCGPALGSPLGSPAGRPCSPRTDPRRRLLPGAPCRTGRWTTPRKRARWSRWWGSLIRSRLPRCLNRRGCVFQGGSVRWAPPGPCCPLRGSGQCQS